MQGMSSIEKAVAGSPLEDYQAIGQAAKKQVPPVHCVALRGLGNRSGSRSVETALVGQGRGRKKRGGDDHTLPKIGDGRSSWWGAAEKSKI